MLLKMGGDGMIPHLSLCVYCSLLINWEEENSLQPEKQMPTTTLLVLLLPQFIFLRERT